MSRSYFEKPKLLDLNAAHYFIMKIPNKRELQQIASNHSPNITFLKISQNFLKDYSKEPYSFLVNDTIIH